MRKINIKGYLCKINNCEEDSILGLFIKNGSESRAIIFAQYLRDIYFNNRQVDVNYYISDIEKIREELELDYITKISGMANISYYMKYSDYTGYLWTTEEFNVGGHNMIEELKSHIGKYLDMEITIY